MCNFLKLAFQEFPNLNFSNSLCYLSIYGINKEYSSVDFCDAYSGLWWLLKIVFDYHFRTLYMRTIGRILSNSYLSWLGWGTWQMGNAFWFIKDLSCFSVSTVFLVNTQPTRVLLCLSGHSRTGWYQQCLYTYDWKPGWTFRGGAYSKTSQR